jgi:hypothetical protein
LNGFPQRYISIRYLLNRDGPKLSPCLWGIGPAIAAAQRQVGDIALVPR